MITQTVLVGNSNTPSISEELISYFQRVLKKYNIDQLPSSDQTTFLLELNRVARLRFQAQQQKSDVAPIQNDQLYTHTLLVLLKELVNK